MPFTASGMKSYVYGIGSTKLLNMGKLTSTDVRDMMKGQPNHEDSTRVLS